MHNETLLPTTLLTGWAFFCGWVCAARITRRRQVSSVEKALATARTLFGPGAQVAVTEIAIEGYVATAHNRGLLRQAEWERRKHARAVSP